ncbi:MAG: T9SS type A sorting domain-containing protein [Bacteroidota bacterium]|nr:T9SS type A sorting domain-containing protein [Bacteroidota bacterium]
MKLSTNSIHLFFVLFLILSFQLSAQWSTNPAVNNAISTAAGEQTNPAIISDGLGGAIITWRDNHNGASYDIYAQRINAYGVIQWTANGVAISIAPSNQSIPAIVSDGSGGAIITWFDSRSGVDNDIFAQKINGSGTVQWKADGVTISNAAGSQSSPAIVSDGSGGAIITWQDDSLNNGANNNIYAQKINASGVTQWAVNGVSISRAANNQWSPTMVSDGFGGAIITWQDYRSNGVESDVYAQKINASGVVQWTPDGVAIGVSLGNEQNPTIVNDGSGGAIITWYHFTGSNYDIKAQKINASGIVRWTANGVVISAATSHQVVPTLVSDGSGGAIITWYDERSGKADIYAQRINASGTVQWTADGVAISTAAGEQYSPKIVSDGSGGTIITWQDFRSGIYFDIYAQRINSSGVVQWTADGVAISTLTFDQTGPKMVSDGSGGAIITWNDYRNGTNYDIFAQRIDPLGNLYPAPWIKKAGDIANDQGGKLRILWDPSAIDVWGNSTVKSYTINLGAKATGILGKSSEAFGSGIYWQTVDIVRADQLEGYSAVVKTYADSGLQGIPMYYFQVIAKNSDSTIYWYSNIDSGYSVDNIPPVGVGGAAIMAINNGSIKLQWNKNNIDKDLMGYVIYRSTTSGVLLNNFTKIKQTADTSYVDTSTTHGATYYYKIAGIDNHGNVGTPSAEVSQIVLSVNGTKGVAPKEFALAQNYPNPFNPSTIIEFTVPATGRATLKIFNAIGQEVATLFNGEAEAGKYHQLQFNASGFASGIYFARLQNDDKVQMMKMMMMK